MKTRNVVLIVMAAAIAVTAYVISTHAQWDEDEEPQRIEEEQWDEAEQTGPVEREATGVAVPSRPTKGEKELEKWEDIPTGYARREYLIRQDNIAGKWDKADIFPAPGFESQWKPIDAGTYAQSVKSGTLDAGLKSTAFGPFYENMQRICKSRTGAKEVHVRSPQGSPEWRMGQRKTQPRTQYRELTFECLIRAK